MEPLSQKMAGLVKTMLICAVALTAGCVNMGHVFNVGDDLPTGLVCQIETTWTNQVVFAPDPTHGGVSSPGLAGRLYLFDDHGFPIVGDGALTIELYDDTAKAKGGEAKLLEIWKFDKETLRRIMRRDTIGWGYSLFLPWGSYRPDIAAVHFKTRYERPKGIPIYNESGPVTLNRGANGTVRAEARTVVPQMEKRDALSIR